MTSADGDTKRNAAAAIAFGVVVTVVTATLGNWQTRRGDAKEVMQARWEAAEAAEPVELSSLSAQTATAEHLPRRVRLKGVLLADATVFVENRYLNGVAGFLVVSPMRIGVEPLVLVNRGWIARDLRDPAARPRIATSGDPVEIEGLAVERVSRLLELSRPQTLRVPGIWPNLDFDDYEKATGLHVARFVVQQTSVQPDGLQRSWLRPDYRVETHRGYALQWYGLALLSGGLTAYFGLRLFGRSRR
jgi:surfeit locus 1 family protein